MKRLIAPAVAGLAILALVVPGLAAHVARPSRASITLLWQRQISPNSDAAPAYASHVALPHARHAAVVYALAGNNTANCQTGDPVRVATLYAFNAGSGSLLWTRSTSGPSRCTTAGPRVDPSKKWVYAAGLDGRIHRYAAGTGAEYRSQGWPKLISKMPAVEKISAQPTIGNGRLYVTTSGFIGDQGHYEGHIVSIDLKTGHTGVFNTLCSNIHHILAQSDCSSVESALFGRGQAEIDPVTHDIWIVTGNGPWNGSTNWGDSVLKLDPTGTHLLDSFTPTNQQSLADSDQDLGSTAPALLPPIRQNGQTFLLMVQGGKGPACGSCSGVALRLLNRKNLSGQGGPGHLGGDLQDIQAPGGCEVLTAPAVWKSNGRIWVFYANDCGTAGYRLSSPSPGRFRLTRVWSDGAAGTTPVMHGGRLYIAQSGGILMRDPTTGNLLARGNLGNVHWQYPLITGTRLYISDQEGHLSAYRVQQ